MRCPHCGFEAEGALDACERCGVVFARLAARSAASATAPRVRVEMPDEDEPDRWPWEDPGARRAFVRGGVAAAVASLVPFTRFVFGYLVVLVHELGHAVAGWAFGYPSIPAFDFMYGGGVTIHPGRSAGLLVLLACGWIALAVWVRENRRLLFAVSGGAAIWALLAATPAHEIVEIAMGHGAELAVAGIFLHRAGTGNACRIAAERPLYAFCGVLMLLHDLRFAGGLLASPLARDLYEDAKGGGHGMDFSRLAEGFLRVDLRVLAASFLVACLATPVLAALAQRFGGAIRGGLARLAGASS